MKKEPSGKVLMILGVWTLVAYAAFPFPINIVIGFIGMVVIIALLGLKEYAVEIEKQEPTVSIEEELPIPILKLKKKVGPGTLSENNRPKVKIELKEDSNNKK